MTGVNQATTWPKDQLGQIGGAQEIGLASRRPAALVTMATTTPGHRPRLPYQRRTAAPTLQSAA